MKYVILICVCFFASFFSVSTAAAKDAPIYTSWRNNLAVGGYDSVSFFSGVPQEGSADFTHIYKDVEWRFASQANLDLFKMNPDAFTPQYGGYCAWAVAMGKLAKGSPKHWYVEDDKLYLNFNARIQKKWDVDRFGFIDRADDNWPSILGE